MAKKPYRPKLIGDPLKKFKQPSKVQECHPQLRKHMEQMMEEDHRSHKPLRSAIVTSSRSGLPDKWSFEKARQLGYKFDDEKEFWEAQCRALRADKTTLEEAIAFTDTIHTRHVVDLERKLRFKHGDKAFEEMAKQEDGSVEGWREAIKKQLSQSMKEGYEAAKTLRDSKQTRPLPR